MPIYFPNCDKFYIRIIKGCVEHPGSSRANPDRLSLAQDLF